VKHAGEPEGCIQAEVGRYRMNVVPTIEVYIKTGVDDIESAYPERDGAAE